MKHLSLRQKTWIFLTIVIVVSLIATLFLTHYLYERFYIDKQINLLVARGDLLAEFYYEDSEDKEEFIERVDWLNQCHEANVIWTEDLQFLLGSNETGGFITIEESKLLQQGKSLHIISTQSPLETPIMGVAVPLLNEEGCLLGVIFLYQTLVEIFEPFQASRFWIVLIFVIWIIFIIYTVRKVMNTITFPLENMRVISEKMAGGDFSQRIGSNTKDEIGSLSNSFNILAATLEKEENKKREFLSNVSHELRTPLSYIKGYTEAILDDVVDNPKKFVETINKESERMHRLVNDLLDLAQLEGESYPMKNQPVPFAQLVQDVVHRFELVAKQKQVEIIQELDDTAIIIGDGDRIEQVIGNLLDNALRYTYEGKTIELVLKSVENGVEFTITDQGQGIPEDALPKIVERFYRVDKARSRKAGGTGLGLSIVAEILKKHNATLTFHSQENKGTTVKIIFPCYL